MSDDHDRESEDVADESGGAGGESESVADESGGAGGDPESVADESESAGHGADEIGAGTTLGGGNRDGGEGATLGGGTTGGGATPGGGSTSGASLGGGNANGTTLGGGNATDRQRDTTRRSADAGQARSRARRLLWTAVAATGVAALVVAAAVATAPDRLIETVPATEPLVDATREFDGTLLLAAVGGLVGLLATAMARVGAAPSSTTDATMDARRSDPPETVSVPDGTVTGDAVDRTFEQVRHPRDLEAIADDLRGTAVAIERTVGNPKDAEEAVVTGGWTDDDLAAAVLSESVAVPVLARLRAWLDPEAEARRRLRRVVTALERRLDGPDGGETGGGDGE
ncbi:hypothetical protein RYH80_01565 [Halobaculum sp. MBLA0147]|uniref:DUF7269 family protein n=1 Tax=Halobaculum sp. MBLA0147 TaxID=3079934 RepID=UPI0035231E29